MTNETQMTVLETKRSLDPSPRQGIYDAPVEIFRAGEFHQAFLSQVMAGDSFRKLPQERWFLARGPVTLDRSLDTKNPTLSMPGVEVLQAKPIAAPKPKTLVAAELLTGPTVGEVRRALANPDPAIGNGEIPPPSSAAKPVPRFPKSDDVQDVEFKD